MIDGIIKGTGNSRRLKSVSNFLSLYPTYADFAAALIAGTLPIDLAGINAAGWQQLATALSKGNLLSDATAAKFKVSTPEMPDAAFAELADYKVNYFPINMLTAEDLNNAAYPISYETGIIAADAVSIGLPSGYYVFKYIRWGSNDGNGVQTANLNGTNIAYSRGSNGTVWKPWVQHITTENNACTKLSEFASVSGNPVHIDLSSNVWDRSKYKKIRITMNVHATAYNALMLRFNSIPSTQQRYSYAYLNSRSGASYHADNTEIGLGYMAINAGGLSSSDYLGTDIEITENKIVYSGISNYFAGVKISTSSTDSIYFATKFIVGSAELDTSPISTLDLVSSGGYLSYLNVQIWGCV